MSGFDRVGFARSALLPALWLFAMPLFGLWFGHHAISTWDGMAVDGVVSSIQADASIPAADREPMIAFYEANPPSVLCVSTDPELAEHV